jgi:hypothetical protein
MSKNGPELQEPNHIRPMLQLTRLTTLFWECIKSQDRDMTLHTTCINTKTLHFARTKYLCVPYGSYNKQRLFP